MQLLAKFMWGYPILRTPQAIYAHMYREIIEISIQCTLLYFIAASQRVQHSKFMHKQRWRRLFMHLSISLPCWCPRNLAQKPLRSTGSSSSKRKVAIKQGYHGITHCQTHPYHTYCCWTSIIVMLYSNIVHPSISSYQWFYYPIFGA